jgi:MFS family permease
MVNTNNSKPLFLDMNRYQWLVLLAAWLGWGFDIFDGLLFNLVADKAIPTLLNVPIGTPEAKLATGYWNGIITALLLLGWAAGGITFGWVADRLGRTKTLLLTMLLYSLGTAACAFAPNIWVLMLFRLVSSFGIGGEWAAGAAMVAEVVPEKRRIEAGALLYTSAPMGLFLANFVSFQLVGIIFKDQPTVAWRYLFACGLLPAFVAFIVRTFIKEPEKWENEKERSAPPRLREIFQGIYLKRTISGFLMSLIALLAWWTVNTCITPLIAFIAPEKGMVETWKMTALNYFNIGGLIGTLLTISAAKFLGRRMMFGLYFLLGSAAIFYNFHPNTPDAARLFGYFFIGLTIFGIFGSFTYYLPELFPTRLRGTGSSFCYNVGRIITAAGPFAIGVIAKQGKSAMLNALFWVGLIPLIGVLLLPLVVETKGEVLDDVGK